MHTCHQTLNTGHYWVHFLHESAEHMYIFVSNNIERCLSEENVYLLHLDLRHFPRNASFSARTKVATTVKTPFNVGVSVRWKRRIDNILPSLQGRNHLSGQCGKSVPFFDGRRRRPPLQCFFLSFYRTRRTIPEKLYTNNSIVLIFPFLACRRPY